MRDEKGFYNALLEETGIQKDWIEWHETDNDTPDLCPPCVPGPHPSKTCGINYATRKNWPKRVRDKSKIKIDNPKEILDEAMPSTDDLIDLAVESYMDMQLGVSDADPADVVRSFSMSIFMMQDASKSISEIKKIGIETKKTHTRELVLNILSIVFAVIPFAGLATSALGVASRLATVALIVGEAGNAVISIVEIVDNPASAPFALLGMLIGASGIRGGMAPRSAFRKAADARRALTSNEMKAFSVEFRDKDKLVQSIIKYCNFR
ncbi:hypothetical protein FAUST_6930 [Fusarium austroamericanum]|uniref:Uncharacterized protein n=1 Tax=Fusarium austroamericanum TaxID=282268 RepID=A0AAN5Z9J8_FUSAU|nr:hypothetical protein FAUST_6930 [Fusarium austroamericanum]